MTSCAKCGGDVDLHDVYVIGFAKHSAMEWIYLCAGCEVALRRWLSRPPIDPRADRRLGLRPERTA